MIILPTNITSTCFESHQHHIYLFWKWRHDYFACQHHIYLFWVLPTSHLLVLQVEQVDVILAGKDIAIVFWYKMRCTEFLRNKKFGILNLGIGVLIWQFSNSRILKKNLLTRISGIGNEIGIPLPMGVPEIGTKNWNSQCRPHPPLSLRHHFTSPNKWTNNSMCKLDGLRLQWTHGELRRHDLGPLWMLPWRYMGQRCWG